MKIAKALKCGFIKLPCLVVVCVIVAQAQAFQFQSQFQFQQQQHQLRNLNLCLHKDTDTLMFQTTARQSITSARCFMKRTTKYSSKRNRPYYEYRGVGGGVVLMMKNDHCTDEEIEEMSSNADNDTARNNFRPMVDSLLSSTMSRAMSTISKNNSNSDQSQSGARAGAGADATTETQQKKDRTGPAHLDVIDAAILRASDQIGIDGNSPVEETSSPSPSPPASTSTSTPTAPRKKHVDKRTYLGNPAVTQTALAHNLWRDVIQPHRDTVIDATAGNGKDALMLATLLFPPAEHEHEDEHEHEHEHKHEHSNGERDDSSNAQLICIDIQKNACENTLSLLEQNLNGEIIKNHIQILHQSHAPMPPLPKQSVGLICYNLGYLPGSNKEAQTKMTTTIYSLADSALMIRPGGLLSVMSYPGNGWKEHCAVHYFMEGMAMFTAKSIGIGGWRGFVESIPSDRALERQHMDAYGISTGGELMTGEGEDSIRQMVGMALERVKEEGFEKQTWRVFDHRPLGRPLSPILFTGIRIK